MIKHGRWLGLALSAMLAAALWATPGGAGAEWTQPTLATPPEGVAPERVITNDPRTTVRGCIGQLDTPYCAVQTLIAGELWSDQTLCDLSGFDQPCASYRSGDIRHPYIINMAPMGWIQLDGDKLERMKKNEYFMEDTWRPGDVFFAIFHTWQGSGGKCSDDQVNGRRSPEDFCPTTAPYSHPFHHYRGFMLRHEEGGWKILDAESREKFGIYLGYLDGLMELGMLPQPTRQYLALSRPHLSMPWEKVYLGLEAKVQGRSYERDTTPPYVVSAVEHPEPSRLPLVPDPPPPLLARAPALLPKGGLPFNVDGAVMEEWMRNEPSWEREITHDTPSSGCLGDVSTPYCTVVTYWAAEMTRNARWGMMTGVGPNQGGVSADEPPSKETVRLRVIPAGIAPLKGGRGWPYKDEWRPGSVTMVVYLRICRKEERCRNASDAPTSTLSSACPVVCSWDYAPWAFQLSPTDSGTWEIIEFDDKRGSMPEWPEDRYKALLPTLERYELRAWEQR